MRRSRPQPHPFKALSDLERYGILALTACLVLLLGYLLDSLIRPARPQLSAVLSSESDDRGVAQESALKIESFPPVAPAEATPDKAVSAALGQSAALSASARKDFDFFEEPVTLPGRRPPARAKEEGARVVKIRPGDTLEKLARRELKDASSWRRILELNPGVSPERLRAGDAIWIPASTAIHTSTMQSEPHSRTHKVVKGETLESIARRYYGQRSRWTEILEANRNLLESPRSLKIGMALRIP